VVKSTLKKFFAYQIEEDVMRQLVEQVFSTLHRLKERRAELKAPQAILYPPRAGFDSPKTRSSKLQENGHGTGASAGLLKSNERAAAAAVGGSKGSPGYDEDSFLCSLLSSQFFVNRKSSSSSHNESFLPRISMVRELHTSPQW
jgi:hypothetical protein